MSFVHAAVAFARRRGLLAGDSRVLVALSGGPDSCALLVALCDAADAGLLPRPVGVAHFHHGLRGADADGDAAFSAALAARLGLFCVIGLGAAHPARGESPNDAARSARYAFLTQAAHDLGASVLATAHTADDQAETVLLRVLRGTGIDGLAGIPPSRDLGDSLRVVRPLLGQSRADVEAFCAARGLTPRHDPSNDKDRYARGRLRRQLPALAAAFNPRLSHALSRLADNASADAALLRSLAETLWDQAVILPAPEKVRLHSTVLANAPPALRRRVLLRALRLVSASVGSTEEAATSEFVAALDALLAVQTGRISLPGGATAERRGDELVIKAPLLDPPFAAYTVPLSVPGRTVVVPALLAITVRAVVPNEPPARARRALMVDIAGLSPAVSSAGVHGTMAAAGTSAPLLVRNARTGDRIAPLGMGGKTRLLSDMMAEARWPVDRRNRAPVIVREDIGEILWVVELVQAESTRVLPNTVGQVWRLTAEGNGFAPKGDGVS